MKTGTKVAIAVGGATVAGVVLYLILRPSASAQSLPPATPTTPPPPTPSPPTPAPPPITTPHAFVQPALASATYLLEPTGPVSAGMHQGETIEIRPPRSADAQVAYALRLMPPQSSPGALISLGPVLQDISTTTPLGDGHLGSGTYKAVAANGTAVVHVTPGDMRNFGGGPQWIGDRGPGFDVTIVVS